MSDRAFLNGRGERIRTSGPMLPKHVRYQTALHPVMSRTDARTAEIMAAPPTCQPRGRPLPSILMHTVHLSALAFASAAVTWGVTVLLERRCPHILRDTSEEAAGKPRIGGIAILIGTAVALVLAPESWRVLLPIAAATGLGVHDDMTDSPAPLRLVGLLLIATLATSLGAGSQHPILVVAWLVAVTVGYDFIDGLDGLAGALSLVAFVTTLVLAPSPWIVAIVGSVMTYLVTSNRPPARTLLGDGGSNGLGMAVGLAVLQVAGAESWGAAPLLLLAAVPLTDGATTLSRRLRSTEGLFTSEKGHLHHRLAELWGSPALAVAEMTLVGAVCAAAGGLAFHSPHALRVAVLASMTALSLLLWRTRATRPPPADSR